MRQLVYALLILSAVLVGCDKYESDDYDFSNTYNMYVELVSTKDVVVDLEESPAAAVKFIVKVAQPEDVTVNYSVTGAFTYEGTATILKATTVGVGVIPVPSSLKSGAVSTLKITGVSGGDGELVVGRLGDKNEVKIVVK